MSLSKKQMIDEPKSIEEPKLIQEGDSQSDNILRIITSQGGYRLEVDAFPMEYHRCHKRTAVIIKFWENVISVLNHLK